MASESPLQAMHQDLGRIVVETSVLRHRLRQGATWEDRDGDRIVISVMPRRHAANVVRFLERRAAWLHEGACREWMFRPAPYGDAGMDAFVEEMDRVFGLTPLEWLHEQPAVLALVARARGHRGGASLSWLLRHPRWLPGRVLRSGAGR